MTTNIYAMTDTWNDGGIDFTAIEMNVTNTASGSGSLLMDLQVGGASVFNIDGAGDVRLHPHTSSGTLFLGSGGTYLEYSNTQTHLYLGSSGHYAVTASETSHGLSVTSDWYLGWASGTWSHSGIDTKLWRDAANTLALRNSTNAQTFNIYNTYTDASNYHRLTITGNGTSFTLGQEAAGTGSVDHFIIQPTVVNGGSGNWDPIKLCAKSNTTQWQLYLAQALAVFDPSVALGWGAAVGATSTDTQLTRYAANIVQVPQLYSSETLDDATGDEIIYHLNYTVNKATSGDDYGIRLSKTDTSSPGTSNMLYGETGGNRVFSLSDEGLLTLDDENGFGVGGGLLFDTPTGLSSPFKISAQGTAALLFWRGSTKVTAITSQGYAQASDKVFAWTNGSSASNIQDTKLYRDAAQTLALRDDTNPNAFNIYNTYTSASVYERGSLAWNSNVFEITTNHTGATARNLKVDSAAALLLNAAAANSLQLQHGGTTKVTLNSGSLVVDHPFRFEDSGKTIASGAITGQTTSYVLISPETTAADDLDVIPAGGDGELLVLEGASETYVVTVRHNQNPAGGDNIMLAGGASFALTNFEDKLFLIYSPAADGGNGAWCEISRSTNA